MLIYQYTCIHQGLNNHFIISAFQYNIRYLYTVINYTDSLIKIWGKE